MSLDKSNRSVQKKLVSEKNSKRSTFHGPMCLLGSLRLVSFRSGEMTRVGATTTN